MGKKEVTREHPCPICGHDHWCIWIDGQNGPLIACHRSDTKETVKGYDGLTYLFVKVGSKGECHLYEEQQQANDARCRWLEEQKRLHPEKYKNVKIRKRTNSSENIAKSKNYINRSQYTKKYIEPDDRHPEHLDQVYREMLSQLILEDKHKDYLRSESWTEDMFLRYSIRSLPMQDGKRYQTKLLSRNVWRKSLCRSIEKKLGKDCFLGIPGFYRDNSGEWNIYGIIDGGIIFPLYDINGYIIRLRIRPDYSEESKDWANKNGKKLGKYINFQSMSEAYDDEKKIIYNTLTDGCRAGGRIGFYMYNYDGNWQKHIKLAFITEGEKKSIVYNYYRGVVCICLPGVSSWRKLFEEKDGMSIVRLLWLMGCRFLVVGFDADKETNVNVLKNERATVEELKKIGFQLATVSWNPQIAKGIDDLIVQNLNPKVHMC